MDEGTRFNLRAQNRAILEGLRKQRVTAFRYVVTREDMHRMALPAMRAMIYRRFRENGLMSKREELAFEWVAVEDGVWHLNVDIVRKK